MNMPDVETDLILASASPRRQELLVQIGVRFTVQPMNIDESVQPGELPDTYVRRMALEKAQAGWQRVGQSAELPVLGADTAVILDDEILGKPENEADAVRMLLALSGREHQVISGVALVNAQTQRVQSVTTQVRFRTLTKSDCLRYWQTGEPADKAGAYGIQGFAAIFIDGIEGSYSSVVGLPLAETADMLEQVGVPVWGA